jgi:hypothetical protein
MIETIRVKKDNAKGYHIINKDNFNPSVHELFDDAHKKRGRKRKEDKLDEQFD